MDNDCHGYSYQCEAVERMAASDRLHHFDNDDALIVLKCTSVLSESTVIARSHVCKCACVLRTLGHILGR
jgi:hypothetical protein